ncbi:MAG: hypothetical protein QOH60_493 [Mycobacterium sp.]|jgi:hypothetical protein|nr:hypothetical protein [Mycobacterium sp.]
MRSSTNSDTLSRRPLRSARYWFHGSTGSRSAKGSGYSHSVRSVDFAWFVYVTVWPLGPGVRPLPHRNFRRSIRRQALCSSNGMPQSEPAVSLIVRGPYCRAVSQRGRPSSAFADSELDLERKSNSVTNRDRQPRGHLQVLGDCEGRHFPQQSRLAPTRHSGPRRHSTGGVGCMAARRQDGPEDHLPLRP